MAFLNIDLGAKKRADLEAQTYQRKLEAEMRTAAQEREQIFRELTAKFQNAMPDKSPEEIQQLAAESAIGQQLAAGAEGRNRFGEATGRRPYTTAIGEEGGKAGVQEGKAKFALGASQEAKANYERQVAEQRDAEGAAAAENEEDAARTSAAILQKRVADTRRSTAGPAAAAKDIYDLAQAGQDTSMVPLRGLAQESDFRLKLSDNDIARRMNFELDPVLAAKAKNSTARGQAAVGEAMVRSPQLYDREREYHPTGMDALVAGWLKGPQGPGQGVPTMSPKQMPTTATQQGMAVPPPFRRVKKPE